MALGLLAGAPAFPRHREIRSRVAVSRLLDPQLIHQLHLVIGQVAELTAVVADSVEMKSP